MKVSDAIRDVSPQVVLVPITYNEGSIAALGQFIKDIRPRFVIAPYDDQWRVEHESRPLVQRLDQPYLRPQLTRYSPGWFKQKVLAILDMDNHTLSVSCMAHELLLGTCRWTLLRTVSSATQEADATLVPVQLYPVIWMVKTGREVWAMRKQVLLATSDQPAEDDKLTEEPVHNVAESILCFTLLGQRYKQVMIKELAKMDVDEQEAGAAVQATCRVLHGG